MVISGILKFGYHDKFHLAHFDFKDYVVWTACDSRKGPFSLEEKDNLYNAVERITSWKERNKVTCEECKKTWEYIEDVIDANA